MIKLNKIESMSSRSDILKAKVAAKAIAKARPHAESLNLLAAPFPTFDVGSGADPTAFVVDPPMGPGSDVASRDRIMAQANQTFVCKEMFPDTAISTPNRALLHHSAKPPKATQPKRPK